jgi:hypothetical protein
MRRAFALAACASLCTALAVERPAQACRILEYRFTPTKGLQIVVWLEDKDGHFVDTLFITEATGLHGLGNRPGIMDFNSEWHWPYGRRESLFPVWAHHRGVTYPKIVFQDGQDLDLSHEFKRSSTESYFCRPLRSDEPARQRSIDANSCATTAFTDKGQFEAPLHAGAPDGGVSLYPPRADLTYVKGTDSADVLMYPMVNDLDAVSRATPAGNAPYVQAFSVPDSVPHGDYVLFVEVSKEFDQNATYAYPSPVLQAYGDYGEPYRGQPSVVWTVPVALDHTGQVTQAADYAGYGDPDGLDGRLRDPDNTISVGEDGSGAQRLLLVAPSSPGGVPYRVQVTTKVSDDANPPAPPVAMRADPTSPSTARVSFSEPAGQIEGYDVRLSLGTPITPDNFMTTGRVVVADLHPGGAGTVQSLDLTDLLPQTRYWVGIRAHDSCLNGGLPVVVELITPRLANGEVSACFVATAAFGSPLAAEVGLLRAFRDRFLRTQALGEVLVEAYYTFGPALADVIGPSDTLRELARGALAPVVERVRSLVK